MNWFSLALIFFLLIMHAPFTPVLNSSLQEKLVQITQVLEGGQGWQYYMWLQIPVKILSWSNLAGSRGEGQQFFFFLANSGALFPPFFFYLNLRLWLQGGHPMKCLHTLLGSEEQENILISVPYCAGRYHFQTLKMAAIDLSLMGSANTGFCLFIREKYWGRKDGGWFSSNLVTGTSDL